VGAGWWWPSGPQCGGLETCGAVAWWGGSLVNWWVVALWAHMVESWWSSGLAGLRGRGLLGLQVGGSPAAVWGWWPTGSFTISWCGEAFHRVGVQGAILSALSCFPSVKCVSRISASSRIPGAHAVCICVPVAILDPPFIITLFIWDQIVFFFNVGTQSYKLPS
jgi:hypothetical protein